VTMTAARRYAPAILSRLRGPRAHVAAWLALLLVTSVWFFTGTDERGKTARPTADADYYHVYLPSLVLDGDLDFANQYELTGNHYGFGRTDIGRPANVFGIGPAVFELPGFLVGHAVASAMGKRANGFSVPELRA
jgi:hypothetical protein